MSKLVLRTLTGFVLLVVFLLLLVFGVVVTTPLVSDGPLGPIPGGEFRTGTLVSDTEIDWSFYLDGQSLELQLVNQAKSRTTGAFVYKDDLYISADLGFIWNRFPQGLTRWILQLIYMILVKKYLRN